MSLNVQGSLAVSNALGINADLVSGVYSRLRPKIATGNITTSTFDIDFNIPIHSYTLNANTELRVTNMNGKPHKVVTVAIYRNVNTGFTLDVFDNGTGNGTIYWQGANGVNIEPNWQAHKIWIISFVVSSQISFPNNRLYATAVPFSDLD